MKIEIKNHYTNKIIIEGEAENIKDFLEKNKGADLQEADLRGADLRGADLWGVNLRGAKIKITQKEELLKSIGIKIDEAN